MPNATLDTAVCMSFLCGNQDLDGMRNKTRLPSRLLIIFFFNINSSFTFTLPFDLWCCCNQLLKRIDKMPLMSSLVFNILIHVIRADLMSPWGLTGEKLCPYYLVKQVRFRHPALTPTGTLRALRVRFRFRLFYCHRFFKCNLVPGTFWAGSGSGNPPFPHHEVITLTSGGMISGRSLTFWAELLPSSDSSSVCAASLPSLWFPSWVLS